MDRRSRAPGREGLRRFGGAALVAASLLTAAAEPPLAQALRPYEEFRIHALLAWHPEQREVLVRRSAAGEQRALAVKSPLAPPEPLPHLPGATGAESFAPPPARLSPDRRRLVAVMQGKRGADAVVVIDVASGRARRVSAPTAKRVRYAHARFSADGRSIFVASSRGASHLRLAHIDLATGRETALTRHAQDVEAIEASPDGKLVAFLTDDGGSSVLRFLDAETLEELPRPPLMAGVVGGLAWRPGASEIGFHVTAARTAGDVFSYDVKENRMARWTNGNNPAVNTRDLAEPRIVRFAGADGREHAAFHYHPPARFAGRRAVVVHLPAAGGEARPEFLGAWNYLVSELGAALVIPRRADVDMAALRSWIAAQPDLDGGRISMARTPGEAAAHARQ